MESASLPDCGNSEYTSCYCEENIYWLIARFLTPSGGEQQWDVFSVFISNPTKTVTDMNEDSYVKILKFITGGIVESAGGIIQRYTSNMGLSRRLGVARASTNAQPIAELLSNQRAGYLDL